MKIMLYTLPVYKDNIFTEKNKLNLY